MAYLVQPNITIGGFDFTGYCTSASVTHSVDALEDTTFSQNYRTNEAGLESNEATVTLLLEYGASGSYENLKDLVGTQTTIVATPAAGGVGFQLEYTYLESLPVLSGSVGELQSIDLTFSFGSYSEI